jgi:ribosomal protein S18 acetylase RimI-like enzyme
MKIRSINEADLSQLAEVYVRAYKEHQEENFEDARAYLEKFCKFDPDCCLAAEDDGGELAGAVIGYSYRKAGRQVLFLQELFIDPDKRHAGFGRELVSSLRAKFENPRVNVVPLVKGDTRVANFYNSLGFEREPVFFLHG